MNTKVAGIGDAILSCSAERVMDTLAGIWESEYTGNERMRMLSEVAPEAQKHVKCMRSTASMIEAALAYVASAK